MDKLKEKGFVKLRITLSDSEKTQSIFLRADSEDPEEKSVYLVNVPVTTTEKVLRNAISKLGGRFVSVYPSIQGLLKAGTNLRVKLLEKAEVKQVLKTASKKSTTIPWNTTQSSGLKRYLEKYDRQFPNARVLGESVESYMKRLTKQEITEKNRLRKLRNQPDEDGFIPVVRGTHQPVGNPEDAEKLLQKKKETGIHKDFYRFQLRDEKKKKLQDLAHKFELDKQRIQHLKVNRRFKPY
ncbi:rRNA processing protein Rrp7 [Schizosaccharomyces cryophilus OY26]|uniref:rRNA processing protein Rrp7 n=1 Tax=Schizosaccharomyces cryophilus (strain OY26 / ATCC MYA-4695 / CBS 11777 / NBRC 106824 / NRRL Y48691) TaxID=653667 RepID=S9VXJ1_SCHCR|nr:rRNA processing protein Rrp7 [Schizosaccharomyces cryophilus OY26]EPY50715.1 rRNA processing protein Rrp7 [Schizosaccharomyces cryophilus OY26]